MDSCLENLGINKLDSTVCDYIQDEDRQSACMGVVEQNPELCMDIKEQDKFNCVLSLVQQLNDKSLCEMLQDSKACYNRIALLPK